MKYLDLNLVREFLVKYPLTNFLSSNSLSKYRKVYTFLNLDSKYNPVCFIDNPVNFKLFKDTFSSKILMKYLEYAQYIYFSDECESILSSEEKLYFEISSRIKSVVYERDIK